MAELAKEVMKSISSKKLWCVNCIVDYSDATDLLKELLKYDGINILEVELLSCEMCGYDKEYMVTVDKDMNLYCEKLYSEDHKVYNSYSAECVYVMEYCNSKCITDYDDFDNFTIVYMNSDDVEHTDCSNCDQRDICYFSDDDMYGFTTSWSDDNTHYSSSYYSSDKDFIDEIIKMFK